MPPTRLQVHESPNLRVTWDRTVCRNSGACLRALPAVFAVGGAPADRGEQWIRLEQGSPDAIIAAVSRCPSGALKAQFVTSVVPSARRSTER